MTRPGFDSAFALLAGAVEAGRIPGGVLGVVTADGGCEVRAIGKAQCLPEVRDMTPETIFDLASLTKVLFSTERILTHARAGRIALDDPLITVIPDLHQYHGDSWIRRITFRQCLGHQTGLPAVWPIYTYGADPATLRAFVLQRDWPHRDTPVYSDINFILLGIALERIEGVPLKQMEPPTGFIFAPPPEATAATEACSWRGRVLVGEVHDENAFALDGAGHAGLFGTADAVLDFLHALMAAPDRLAEVSAPLSDRRAHGWERHYAGWPGGDACSPASIGHTGFTGTGAWLDPAAGFGWCLLTNRVHPSRHTDSGIAKLRCAVGEALFHRVSEGER